MFLKKNIIKIPAFWRKSQSVVSALIVKKLEIRTLARVPKMIQLGLTHKLRKNKSVRLLPYVAMTQLRYFRVSPVN
ncbi:hypothetical protein DP115_15625 [Brasilonema octagenarum UFV-OR1]|uniref:Uncharacterized protein n=1 Tax=Brasilonema octagenarum UFV-OR1 TaxID=417115 RepID=A0ABX1MAQ5_9CYAN|nr:hypothetical protein [Brasilonema octagenarum UFV-OR1]